MTHSLVSTLLAHYLVAQARYAEARRAMSRAARTFAKLARHFGDDRAATLAGVHLADARSVAACQRRWRVRQALAAVLDHEPTVTRLVVWGAVLCAELPRAANHNRQAVPPDAA